MLVLTQVLSLMQLLVWSCDMHVMEDGQSNDLKALDVVLNKTTHANGVTVVCGAQWVMPPPTSPPSASPCW